MRSRHAGSSVRYIFHHAPRPFSHLVPRWPRQAPEDAEAAALSALIDGPPAPAAPAVINRDENGNATVRAIRVASPIVVDGRLDEAIYREELSISGFMQVLPGDGDPATEKTEAWIAFDENNIYVGA